MMNLYNAIVQRKSVRKYDMERLPKDELDEIKEYVNQIEPLKKDIKVEFTYLNADDVNNILPVKAPHYLCIYSEEAEDYLMNVGFMLQQADLYFSSKGLGSCWLGMAKPSKEVPAQLKGMKFVIMLAFGNGMEAVHRSDLSEFKRKDLAEVGTAIGVDEILNAVRFAPSATNSQPWFITGDVEKLQVYREKLGLIKAALYGKMNQIDIGIALCHIFMTAKELGKEATLLYDKKEETMAPKELEYMTSVKF